MNQFQSEGSKIGALRFLFIQWAHGPQQCDSLSRLCRKKNTQIRPFKSIVPQAFFCKKANFILVYEKMNRNLEDWKTNT